MKLDLPLSNKLIERLNWYLQSERKQRNKWPDTKKPIRASSYGLDAYSAFNLYVSANELARTRHPNILKILFSQHEAADATTSFMAEQRKNGYLKHSDLKNFRAKFNVPIWFLIEIIEKSKHEINR